ncbi:hypothetical protein [Hugenholtzia roseola]|uniref:hypothetical protein n=1 Tax=Hugenholtzia roseola TaxID=1002 RepID=UPI000424E58D|nr:hypothetical protein [Hugenholtzia roseola]
MLERIRLKAVKPKDAIKKRVVRDMCASVGKGSRLKVEKDYGGKDRLFLSKIQIFVEAVGFKFEVRFGREIKKEKK